METSFGWAELSIKPWLWDRAGLQSGHKPRHCNAASAAGTCISLFGACLKSIRIDADEEEIYVALVEKDHSRPHADGLVDKIAGATFGELRSRCLVGTLRRQDRSAELVDRDACADVAALRTKPDRHEN
jgi:hypothetical protein